ncbi:hypothetical protein [Sphingomonas sp. Leaf25]|uniref:hypothetical protein n=1 Tax=Sphingomonas sp. Leaf25 TaxID=1735692 RepID=UPI0012E2A042|nr:hypothetical protein [Sphingomonas sp. Leaf25]
MRTNLEFRSSKLSDVPSADGVPVGEAVANLLKDELPKHGFAVSRILPEDWGWIIWIENPSFPLWVGCGFYGEWDDGMLLFIQPNRPYVRRWFRKLSVAETVERLAMALESIVRQSGKASEVRWWTESENIRG